MVAEWLPLIAIRRSILETALPQTFSQITSSHLMPCAIAAMATLKEQCV
jgi:hypothetical protein